MSVGFGKGYFSGRYRQVEAHKYACLGFLSGKPVGTVCHHAIGVETLRWSIVNPLQWCTHSRVVECGYGIVVVAAENLNCAERCKGIAVVLQ